MTTAGPGHRVARKVTIGRVEAFAAPRRVIEVDGIGIGIFRLGDRFTAYLNVCPHLGGPVCQGRLMPRTLESTGPDCRALGLAFSSSDTHIVCPWHGYEFDVATGAHPADPALRLRAIPIEVVDGELVIVLPSLAASPAS